MLRDSNGLPRDPTGLLRDSNGLLRDSNGLPRDPNGFPKDSNPFPRDSSWFPRDPQNLDWKRHYGFVLKLLLKQAQNQLHKGVGPSKPQKWPDPLK